jgi:hypothetical protein
MREMARRVDLEYGAGRMTVYEESAENDRRRGKWQKEEVKATGVGKMSER